jgi:pimeloyl-ACP methyl ester carboxylesterase
MYYGRRHWRGFAEFVARKSASERHSTRIVDDSIDWALETDWRTVDRASRAAGQDTWNALEQRRLGRAVRCPLLVIHGDADRMNPYRDGKVLARLAPQGRLVTVRGGGHAIFGRRPVELNLALREFVDSLSR